MKYCIWTAGKTGQHKVRLLTVAVVVEIEYLKQELTQLAK